MFVVVLRIVSERGRANKQITKNLEREIRPPKQHGSITDYNLLLRAQKKHNCQ